MRHTLVLSSALLSSCLLLQSPSAHADTFTFQFTSSSNPSLALAATGTITTVTDPTNPGVQDVVGLSGTLENGALTGNFTPVAISLVPVTSGQTAANPSMMTFNDGIDPTNGKPSIFYFGYDNFYTPGGSSLFDMNGLAFESADGIFYDLGFYNGSYVYEAFNNSESFDQRTFGANLPTVDVQIPAPATAVTPEPSSFALLGTGLLGTAGILRRRFRS